MELFGGIKKLGFGLMRLPLKDGRIDTVEFERMVSSFINSGYSYFDTAPGYMNGESESLFKRFVVEAYPRHQFQIATKMPAWDLSRVNSEHDVIRVFNQSLCNTGVDFFDYYLLHNIGGERTHLFDKYNVWRFVQERKKDGTIRHYGISFHGKATELESIITEHPDVEFIQLQINYADWTSTQVDSKECYNVAVAHSKPVIVMEPLKGGTLFSLPDSYSKELAKVNDMSNARWAFRWLEPLSQVKLVLSGMSSLAQLKENVLIYDSICPLDQAELLAIEQVQKKIAEASSFISCTGCLYCRTVCPCSIPIDQVLASLSIYRVYDNISAALNKYRFQTREGNTASTCIGCKSCEKVCPQQLPIGDLLQKASSLFDK